MRPSTTSARAVRRKKNKNGIAHPFARPPKPRHPFFAPSLRATAIREAAQQTDRKEE